MFFDHFILFRKKKIFQVHLVLSLSPNCTRYQFLQGAQASLSGERCLNAKIHVLDGLIAFVVLLLPGDFNYGEAKKCMYYIFVPVYISISIYLSLYICLSACLYLPIYLLTYLLMYLKSLDPTVSPIQNQRIHSNFSPFPVLASTHIY